MNRFMIMIALFLFGASVFAAGPDGTSEPVKPSEKLEVQKETSQQESTKDSKQPEWPRPYKPTEEISADSVVPFPADI